MRASRTILQARSPIVASVALSIGGMMWGLFWIPVSAIAAQGAGGAWPGIVLYFGALVFLLPVIWRKRGALYAQWRVLVVSGILTGAAFSLFTTSLVLTEIVRAILLFYLTPIWGTVLGAMVLSERLTLRRMMALVLSLGGMLIVLGLGRSFPWPSNAGDWLALASGLVWAFGSMKLYQGQQTGVSEQVIAFLAGGLAVSIVTFVLGGAAFAEPVSAQVLWRVLPYALVATLFVVPMVFLTIWPATLLSPGRVGLLMMSEIVVGVASAALFSGQLFGWREATGAALIVSGALVEVFGPQRRSVRGQIQE